VVGMVEGSEAARTRPVATPALNQQRATYFSEDVPFLPKAFIVER
jgi:hypothetical protein